MIAKNNKGTILVVAVVAMMIMIVIGFVCFQMYINQGIFNTFDSAKKRTYYSAEGAIQMMMGYIDKNVNTDNDDENNGRGYVDTRAIVNNTGTIGADNNGWCPFTSSVLSPFDKEMYPHINVEVYLRRLTDKNAVHIKNFIDNNSALRSEFKNAFTEDNTIVGNRAYEIIAKAKTSHKTALINKEIVTVMHCYFYTEYSITDAGTPSQKIKHKPIIVAWRVD